MRPRPSSPAPIPRDTTRAQWECRESSRTTPPASVRASACKLRARTASRGRRAWPEGRCRARAASPFALEDTRRRAGGTAFGVHDPRGARAGELAHALEKSVDDAAVVGVDERE